MKNTMKFVRMAAIAAAIAAPALASAGIPDVVTVGAKNVVLVPGAFVDGSSFRAIHDQLWLRGYKVTVAQQPHSTLDDDVAAVREAIEAQDGPVVLVGHSYGGSVISIAGTNDKVKALVYIAAFQPEAGESAAQLVGTRPAPNNDVKSTRDGHLYLDPAKFREDFAADLPPNRTNFMSIAQVKITQAAFTAPGWAAAWHDKPTYAILTTEDRALNPDLQRWMYKRAGSKVTELKASHAVQLSQPEAVAKVIVDAARSVPNPSSRQ
jgi:pimeloyl-ACP methyl ester carboxylesterase